MRFRTLSAISRRWRSGHRLCPFMQRQAVEMIDAGASHGEITRQLGFTGAEIDCILRQRSATP